MKKYAVALTASAQAAIEAQARYLAVDEHSPVEAQRWLEKIWDARADGSPSPRFDSLHRASRNQGDGSGLAASRRTMVDSVSIELIPYFGGPADSVRASQRILVSCPAGGCSGISAICASPKGRGVTSYTTSLPGRAGA